MKFLSKFLDLPYVSGFSCKKVQLNLASSLIIESGKQTWDFKPIQDGVKKSPPPPPPLTFFPCNFCKSRNLSTKNSGFYF